MKRPKIIEKEAGVGPFSENRLCEPYKGTLRLKDFKNVVKR